jgi:hypothetical protein
MEVIGSLEEAGWRHRLPTMIRVDAANTTDEASAKLIPLIAGQTVC